MTKPAARYQEAVEKLGLYYAVPVVKRGSLYNITVLIYFISMRHYHRNRRILIKNRNTGLTSKAAEQGYMDFKKPIVV